MALNYEYLRPLVDKAVRVAHSSFPAHHDRNDTAQVIWLWVVEKEGWVRDVIARQTQAGDSKPIYNMMLREAYAHLKKEDSVSYDYNPEDTFYYSVPLIEKILEVIFSYEDWQNLAVALDAMPKSKSDPATAGDNLASYADVKSAVEKLPERQYNAIVWRYKYRYSQEAVGEELGMTREGARQLLNGAVKAVQRILGARDYSDLRKASERRLRPNGTIDAIHQSDSQYDGS